VFGADYPFLITCAAGMILTIFIVHAALAMRKFPESYRSYRTFRDHMAAFRHNDTSLWWLLDRLPCRCGARLDQGS
jgi:fumarate reductase subunit C